MAAKAGVLVGGLLLIVLVVGVMGGDSSVHIFGDQLYTFVHWLGHWIGKLGHWIGETWNSFFGDHTKKTA